MCPMGDDTGRQATYRSSVTTPTYGLWRGRGPAVVLSLVLAVVAVAGTIGASHRQTSARDLDAFAFLLLVAGPAALLWLRRWPVPVMWAVVVITWAYLALGYPYGPAILSTVVALFSAVLMGHRLAAWSGFAALYVGHLAARRWLLDESLTWGQLLGVGAWGIVVLTVAEVARVRRERMAAAFAARREGARRRENEERLRIARDLHDVVAHHMSLINVQAGVALHLVDRRPDQVETALQVIKDASKEALTELRSLVGVLREEGAAPRAPAPMLDSLDALVERSALAGLTVRTGIEGNVTRLPAAVDLSAFRILQEAVTNVIRHASADSATITLEYGDQELRVQVDDDGTGLPRLSAPRSPPSADGGGSGLAGMRERAAALGGSVVVGPSPSGGTRVLAVLPVRGAP